jgi:hypothetical protein
LIRPSLVASLVILLAAGCWAQDKLLLPNETSIELVRDTRGSFLGLGAVSIGGMPVCLARPPMLPTIETEAGTTATRVVLDSVDQGARCAVVCRLEGQGGQTTGDLRLVIRPEELAIGGKWYVGFAYQYILRSDREVVTRLIDRTHWELGGRSDRLYLVPPHRQTSAEPLSLRRSPEFLRTPCFYFQGGKAGSLVVAYDFDEAAPLIFTSLSKRAGNAPLQLTDEVNVVPGTTVRTPWRYVLLCKQDNLAGLQFEDEFTRCYEFFVRKVRDHFGIPAESTRRLCVRPADGFLSQSTATNYDNVIAMLDEVAELGFERLWQGCVWDNAGARRKSARPDLSLLGFDFSPYGGGEQAVRRLCDAADARDLKLCLWVPTGQLSTASPYWETNPEWFARRADGSYYTCGAGGLAWLDLNTDYYLRSQEAFQRLHDLGVAGVWLDSFAPVASVVNYAAPSQPGFNLLPAFRRIKELLDTVGFESVYVEGESPVAIQSPTEGQLADGGYTCYKTAGFYYHLRPTETNWYYRLLANGSTPIVALHDAEPEYVGTALADHPEQLTRVAYANQAFRRVRADMVQRSLLRSEQDPWTCTGVCWTSADGLRKVYWPFFDYSVQLAEGERAYDVVNGEEVPTEASGAFMHGERVYVVERSAPE